MKAWVLLNMSTFRNIGTQRKWVTFIYTEKVKISPEHHISLPGKANTSGLHVVVSKDTCRDDLSMLCQELLQFCFIHVRRQVGNVQIGGVLLLLLGHLCLDVGRLKTFDCFVCGSWQLKVYKPVACWGNPALVFGCGWMKLRWFFSYAYVLWKGRT